MARRSRSLIEIGRVGRLTMSFACQDRRTVMTGASRTSPWHLFPPIYLDDTGSAYTLLVNPSGGLVGGDRLSIHMTLAAQSHVIVSTPSANRVYRSRSKDLEAIQTIKVMVGEGAILEWAPEHTIPYAGSRFRQTIQVRLAPNSTVMLWDAMAAGRVAQEERWAFSSLANHVAITTASGVSVIERYRLDHASAFHPAGIARSWDYVASLYIVSDALNPDAWKTLEARIGDVLDAEPGALLGGVSTPAVPGVVVKLVARSAPVLTAALEQLWAAVRFTLWGQPPVTLRKY
ncbi:urease accessory protein UreD [Nitrospira sp. Nam80]